MQHQDVEILLIEDSMNDAEMTIRALRKGKISDKILHLADGAAALDFLSGNGAFLNRNLEQKPKVILLDLKMPKVDGMEVLEKIKADVNTRTIPVVVLTSSKEDPDIEKCYLLGANSYIVKPVDFVDFRKVVNEVGLYWAMNNQPPV